MKTLVLWTSLLVMQAPAARGAELPDENNPSLELRNIMREMNRDMLASSRALVLGDWPQVVHHAEKIANHGKPPLGERVRILALINNDVGQFKALDDRVVDAAEDLASAAAESDTGQSINALKEMTSACLACHTRFREKFVNHFYP